MLESNVQELVATEVNRLRNESLSIMMATKSEAGMPHISYTPFACVGQNFYVLTAGLAWHAKCIQANPELNFMLIDDESKSRNIYARARLSYEATATKVEKSSDEYVTALNNLRERTGKTVDLLDGLNDFMMFRFSPQKATLVLGFGKAYVFDPEEITGAIQLTDKNINELQGN